MGARNNPSTAFGGPPSLASRVRIRAGRKIVSLNFMRFSRAKVKQKENRLRSQKSVNGWKRLVENATRWRFSYSAASASSVAGSGFLQRRIG